MGTGLESSTKEATEMNNLMEASAAVLASLGNLVSNAGRWTDDFYWNGRVDLQDFVIIHKDHFDKVANLWDEYQTVKAEDEVRQRETDQQDTEDTVASFQGDLEGAIKRGARR